MTRSNAPTCSTSAPAIRARRTDRFAERLVCGAFAAMPRGRLHMQLPDGSTRVFGDPAAGARELAPGVSSLASMRVRRPAFFRKCALRGDLGFAESYIDGDWDSPDVASVVAWFVHNHDTAPTLSGSRHARRLGTVLLRWAYRLGAILRTNDREAARRHIREHYDLSNDFFALWLDPSLMYSAARWENPDASLAEAQLAKNEALCRKLRLRPDDRVLEIGTGWGGWSLHTAARHGCRVTTVTISKQQFDLARRRAAEAGLADRIEIRLQDFRDISGSFDKIVSIEMLEAIGHRQLAPFARQIDRLLAPDGLLALQFINCPDARYDQLRAGMDFIQRHIFPGSLLLSVNRVNNLLSRAGRFMLHGLEDMGRDYARTLREWRARFNERHADVRALGFDDRFIRKWHYYLCYCEAAFAMRHISVVQTVHTRPNNLAL